MAERRKTTMYLDADLLRATKIAAAREDKAEYLIIEEALREHLGRGMLNRIQVRAGLTEDEATRLAVEETRATRRAMHKERPPRAHP